MSTELLGSPVPRCPRGSSPAPSSADPSLHSIHALSFLSSAPTARLLSKSQGTGTAVCSFLVLNEIKTTKNQENFHFQAFFFFQDGPTTQLPESCQLFILEGLKVQPDNIFLSALI